MVIPLRLLPASPNSNSAFHWHRDSGRLAGRTCPSGVCSSGHPPTQPSRAQEGVRKSNPPPLTTRPWALKDLGGPSFSLECVTHTSPQAPKTNLRLNGWGLHLQPTGSTGLGRPPPSSQFTQNTCTMPGLRYTALTSHQVLLRSPHYNTQFHLAQELRSPRPPPRVQGRN